MTRWLFLIKHIYPIFITLKTVKKEILTSDYTLEDYWTETLVSQYITRLVNMFRITQELKISFIKQIKFSKFLHYFIKTILTWKKSYFWQWCIIQQIFTIYKETCFVLYCNLNIYIFLILLILYFKRKGMEQSWKCNSHLPVFNNLKCFTLPPWFINFWFFHVNIYK